MVALRRTNCVRLFLWVALVSIGALRCGGGGENSAAGPAPFVAAVAFLADRTTDEEFGLFVTDLEGSEVRDLSGPLVPGGDVREFQWSPDRSKIAFLADRETDEVVELYVVPADGGQVTKVSGDLAPDGDVSQFGWSPQGDRLAFVARETPTSPSELYVVKADGTSLLKVNATPTAPTWRVEHFLWSPDGTRLAYRMYEQQSGEQSWDADEEYYSVAADGTGHAKLTGPWVAWRKAVLGAAWSPDSSRFTLRMNQNAKSAYELFTAKFDGSELVRVSGDLVANGQVSLFRWAPDGKRIAYLADQETDGTTELFTSLPDGTQNTKISGTMVASGSVADFRWFPDGSAILFHASREELGRYELWRAPATGGTVVRLNQPLPAGGSVQDFGWSPDRTKIAYIADGEVVDLYELYVISPDGSNNAKISVPKVEIENYGMMDEESDGYFLWSPDNLRVAYVAHPEQEDLYDVYVSSQDGGMSVNLTDFPSPDYWIDQYVWSVDGSRVFYKVGKEGKDVGLYSVRPDGSGTTLISGPLVAGANVTLFSVK